MNFIFVKYQNKIFLCFNNSFYMRQFTELIKILYNLHLFKLKPLFDKINYLLLIIYM